MEHGQRPGRLSTHRSCNLLSQGSLTQQYDYNCGVFVCCYAGNLTRRTELDFSQADIPEKRKQIKREIASGTLLWGLLSVELVPFLYFPIGTCSLPKVWPCKIYCKNLTRNCYFIWQPVFFHVHFFYQFEASSPLCSFYKKLSTNSELWFCFAHWMYCILWSMNDFLSH